MVYMPPSCPFVGGSDTDMRGPVTRTGWYVHGLVCPMCTSGRRVEGKRPPPEKPLRMVNIEVYSPKEVPPWGYSLGFLTFCPFCTVLTSQGPEPPFHSRPVNGRTSLFHRGFSGFSTSFLPGIPGYSWVLMSERCPPMGPQPGVWAER